MIAIVELSMTIMLAFKTAIVGSQHIFADRNTKGITKCFGDEYHTCLQTIMFFLHTRNFVIDW